MIVSFGGFFAQQTVSLESTPHPPPPSQAHEQSSSATRIILAQEPLSPNSTLSILTHRSLSKTPLNELSEKAYVKFDGVVTCEDTLKCVHPVDQASAGGLRHGIGLGIGKGRCRCKVDGGGHCFGWFIFQQVSEWETRKTNKDGDSIAEIHQDYHEMSFISAEVGSNGVLEVQGDRCS